MGSPVGQAISIAGAGLSAFGTYNQAKGVAAGDEARAEQALGARPPFGRRDQGRCAAGDLGPHDVGERPSRSGGEDQAMQPAHAPARGPQGRRRASARGSARPHAGWRGRTRADPA